MEEDETSYDILCLCCGGRNGEDRPLCSVRAYPRDKNAEGFEDPSDWFQNSKYDYASWFESADYLGSIVVPVDFELTEDHREFLVLLTRDYQPDDRPMFFNLPYETDATLPGTSVDRLLN